jgi:3-hydroxybutyryl-CoA dehydrogenase
MHFFNPVPVLARRGDPCRHDLDETAAVVQLARSRQGAGRGPRRLGFAANRILIPFINEAVTALADGVASAESIDTVAKLGFGHPIGPLALADLIGLDTLVLIMDVMEAGLGDPKYGPHPLLREHVAAGRLGRKSGRGFFDYG